MAPVFRRSMVSPRLARGTAPGRRRRGLFALTFSVLAWTGLVGSLAGQDRSSLPTRGVEEGGRMFIGEPLSAFAGDLAVLFVTGKQPAVGNGTAQDTIDWASDPLHSVVADGTGALVVYAHPDAADRVLRWTGLTGMELYSSGTPSAYRDQMWDTVLTTLHRQGRPLLWAFAADDTHYTVPGAFNFAWNTVLVPSVDLPSLKQALRTGAFYATSGPVIEGVSVIGTTITLDLGQPSDVLWLRAGQYNAPGAAFTETTELGQGRSVKIDQGVTAARLDVSSLGLPLSDLRFVRAIVRTSVTADALTQPFVVLPGGSVANPYPASGTWIRGQSHNHDDAGIGTTTALAVYRENYRAVGQVAAFETAYSYWETPYQRLDSDGIPDVTSVAPRRISCAGPSALTIRGVNFAPGATAQLGPHVLDNVTLDDAHSLRAIVPAGVPAGVYDVVVTNPDRYRGALALGVTVQAETADDAGWTSYGAPDLPWDQATSVAAVHDEVWVGTMLGAARYKDGAWTGFTPGSGFSRAIYDIAADPLGGLWFSSVGLWFGGPAGTLPWESQLVNDPAGRSERWGRMAFDATGRLWVASRWGEGLAIHGPSGWVRWTRAEDGLPSDDTQVIACDRLGHMWVGFGGGLGIRRWDGSAWQPVAIPSDLPRATFASAIVADAAGDVWVAVQPMNLSYTPQASGVVRFRRDGTTVVYKAPQLPHPRVTDILVTQGGDVWFSSRAGVSRLDPSGQWRTFTAESSGLASNIVTAMAEGRSGTVWFATAHGVSSFTPPGSAENHAPSATDDAYRGDQDLTLTVAAPGVLGNDIDPDDDPLSAALMSAPMHGIVALSADGSFTYRPVTGSYGADTFTYVATDTSAAASPPATVTITVTRGNVPPAVQAPADQRNFRAEAVSLPIVASDPEGGPLSWSATGLPAGLVINVATGLISGSVAPAASGIHVVAATASDPAGAGTTVTFSWTIVDGIGFKAARVAQRGGARALDIPAPAGVVAGNVMLASINVAGTAAITAPTGWSIVGRVGDGTTLTQAVYYRVAAAGERASYTWTFSSIVAAVGGIAVYGGVDPARPVDVAAGQVNPSASVVTAPSVTTMTLDAVLVGVFATGIITAIAPPAGMIERGEGAASAGKLKVTAEMADARLAGAGPTGTRTATTAKAAPNVGHLVALRPVSASAAP